MVNVVHVYINVGVHVEWFRWLTNVWLFVVMVGLMMYMVFWQARIQEFLLDGAPCIDEGVLCLYLKDANDCWKMLKRKEKKGT